MSCLVRDIAHLRGNYVWSNGGKIIGCKQLFKCRQLSNSVSLCPAQFSQKETWAYAQGSTVRSWILPEYGIAIVLLYLYLFFSSKNQYIISGKPSNRSRLPDQSIFTITENLSKILYAIIKYNTKQNVKLCSTTNHLTYDYNPALNEQSEYRHNRNHSSVVQFGELQLHSEK